MSDPICPYGCPEHDFGCAGPSRPRYMRPSLKDQRPYYAMAAPEDQRRYTTQAIAWSLAAAVAGVALSFAICFAIFSRCS